jgi:threonine dehydrogenase-like Zn-dependent dehydrogenase
MCFLMKVRMLGAGNIIAVDLSDYRLQYANRLGADYLINASNPGSPRGWTTFAA